ncbi:glycerophosphodiester phosphodiesterase [Paracidobacterium acidisoli]|nr:glycerophosphodiester phosphodiesterase family protein [Paracidobacterium acidisoli]MBT9333126.1 hypothetical protein [Paracidobacterium acidisoli]
MTNPRARDGSDWDLVKLQREMQRPVDRENLILVTAHRGDWDICPENTIEGAMMAMDQKLELVELDVRVTTDGIPYLTHDWDLRGEALNANRDEATENNIYKIESGTLAAENRVKPDRHGYPGKSGGDDRTIHFQTFRQFLETYLDRVQRLDHGVVDHVVRRGAGIVVDIKGEDRVVTDLEYEQSLQYTSLQKILREVHRFEQQKGVSLKNVLIYKVNLKSMRQITETPVPNAHDRKPLTADEFNEFLRTAEIGYTPGLIFIVYPEDWVKSGPKETYSVYHPWLEDYRKHYEKLLAVDWQTRYPNINLEAESLDDVNNDRGVGAFVSYNPFPEGGRRSDGTCTFQGNPDTPVRDPNLGTMCLQQGLKTYASASIEFFFPPRDSGLPLLATSLTTDMYENAVNYLRIMGRRHTDPIKWTGGDEKGADDRQGVLGLPPGEKIIDWNYESRGQCRVFDTVSEVCAHLPENVHLNQDVGGFAVVTNEPSSTATIMRLNEGDMKTGFTVAIELPEGVANNVTNISTVITVLNSHGQPAFSVLRGRDGSWYAGKLIDRVLDRSFDTKLWDPVSPCSSQKPCAAEMVYVSVSPYGEVRIDDFGIYKQKLHKVFGNWQSTLLNYGIPVTEYQPGADREYPNQPTENPRFIEISGVGIGKLAYDLYGADSIYKNPNTTAFVSLPISRFAVWREGMIGEMPEKSPSLFRGVEQAILRDMQARFNKYQFDPMWLPCNSGQYEVNRQGEGLNGPTTQYDPTDIATPCTPDGRAVPVPSLKLQAGSVTADEDPE